METIFRLAADRSPGRWDKSAISASERKIWDELREGLGGSISVENVSLDQILRIKVPRPYDAGLWERYCDVMAACQALRMSLDSGAICASYRDENGVQHAVSDEFWRGDDECVITALLNGAAYLDVASNHELISSRLLRLPTPELTKAWPELISRGFRESEEDETTLPPRRESKPLSPLQERILELARGLWPDGKLPPRILDRDNQILKKWPDGQRKPDPKTIQRAFKPRTQPDN